jgi:hypothetical protein
MQYKYEGKIQFTTDKELTETELNQLISAIELQIEEPTDADGNDEQFKTASIVAELEPKKMKMDLYFKEMQFCLICEEVKPLAEGVAVLRYGSFVEFTCNECREKAVN